VRMGTEQFHAWQRFNELMQRLARGELTEREFRTEYMQFAAEETGRFVSQAATLSMSYYNALFGLAGNYNKRVYERMFSAPPRETYEPVDTPQRVEIAMHGRVGDVIKRTLTIENYRSTTADISFGLSDFQDLSGTARFRSPLQILPSSFRLAPGQEQSVTFQLALTPDLFRSGREYRATIVVSGYDNTQLLLTITVEAPAREAASGGLVIRAEADEPFRGTASALNDDEDDGPAGEIEAEEEPIRQKRPARRDSRPGRKPPTPPSRARGKR